MELAAYHGVGGYFDRLCPTRLRITEIFVNENFMNGQGSPSSSYFT